MPRSIPLPWRRWTVLLGTTLFLGSSLLAANEPPEFRASLVLARRYEAAELRPQALAALEPFRSGTTEQAVLVEAGRIRFDGRDYHGAADEYRRLLQLLPDQPIVRRNLLVSLAKSFQDMEARELLVAMGSAADGDARAIAVRGLLAARADDLGAAERDLEAAQALDVSDAFAPYELGLLRLSRGDAAGAVTPLREALRRTPEEAQNSYNLGLALTRSGKTAEGEAALARAQAITERANADRTRQRRAVALAMRAQEALQRGDATAALRDLELAVALQPQDPTLRQWLEEARKQAGGAAQP